MSIRIGKEEVVVRARPATPGPTLEGGVKKRREGSTPAYRQAEQALAFGSASPSVDSGP
jgi:hypothetical protein